MRDEKGNPQAMLTQPAPVPTTPGMTYDHLLERVRYEGAYPTRETAADVVHTVLAALGRQLTGAVRAELSACLPIEAALTFTAQIPAPRQLTGWGFVEDIATRTGRTPVTARWDTGTVLRVLPHLAGAGMIDRILAQLPAGYALLFGRAELTQAA
jgi:uncharacterized protein (DUF2267 family)